MYSLFDSLIDNLTNSWKTPHAPRSKRAYRCQCDRPVFFRNSQCLACEAPLGYEPTPGEVRTLHPGVARDTWRLTGDGTTKRNYRRCANFESAAGCNWLVPEDDSMTHCVACRLNRTIPDLGDSDNRRYWRAMEVAKRRLVSQLLALGLPVEPKTQNPEKGLAFDMMPSARRSERNCMSPIEHL